jgi:hypothetical protein|tara:strand:+ start:337 stop:522 length:186 start_codon:yes stop_codon:yes gene_type:complete
MKSNYDQLAAVLQLWYSNEQIKEIWELLKDYDSRLMNQSKITKETPAEFTELANKLLKKFT